jgi:hypothetical protein
MYEGLSNMACHVGFLILDKYALRTTELAAADLEYSTADKVTFTFKRDRLTRAFERNAEAKLALKDHIRSCPDCCKDPPR